jgi:RimJ/RimL family protein N-acetyltransferase
MKVIGENIGFKLEGILKKYKFCDGDFRDFCLMAITRDDWNCLSKQT